ncbi:MAG: minichromosome maintenance protein MCM [DPANN group archaeon]|nr:minichromosome maintenance protein MCM [DPANN group archaeon]
MDYSDILRKFEVFFSDIYYKQLILAVQSVNPIVVDFEDFESFDPELADYFLEKPEECLLAADEAIANIDIGDEELSEKIAVRFTNIPNSEMVPIKNIRSKHINKFIAIKGLIKQASEVRPEITVAIFECPACSQTITLIQSKPNLIQPYMCECGNRRGFELTDRRLVDLQRIVVEENPGMLEGGQQARKIGVYLRNDLVDPTFQKKVVPGNEVSITGIIKDVPIRIEQGKETKKRDIYLEANYLETIVTEFEDIIITKEEEKLIKKMAADKDIYDKLKYSIAPSIEGHLQIKEAISLQLFSGVTKVRSDGVRTRGDIHMLLIGDPGAGKSQMLKYVSDLAPKGKYIVGKSASGAGITAAVVKDEFTGGWSLEAGALVLANNGLAAIDEMDKMSDNDRSAMHEAMEQQTVTVSKATIQATLSCKTIILAAANPKFGRFDTMMPIPDQINLPDTLISRFDLIFPIKDIPNREVDTRIAKHILKLHENPTSDKPPIETDMLRKFIAYSRKNCSPKLTKGATDKIQKFYVDIRNQNGSDDERSAVPLTARQLEALVRLSEANARVRLSEKVLAKDADKAIRLLTYCLNQVGIDPETGKFDIDRMSSGTTTSQRGKIIDILRIIDELTEESLDKMVDKEDIIARAQEEGIADSDAKIEEIITKLKNDGELFEPRNGKIKKV